MSDITVNWPRIAAIAGKMEFAIADESAPTTEKYIAALITALKIAHDAQPHKTPMAIADLAADVMGNLLLEYRQDRLPVKFIRAERKPERKPNDKRRRR